MGPRFRIAGLRLQLDLGVDALERALERDWALFRTEQPALTRVRLEVQAAPSPPSPLTLPGARRSGRGGLELSHPDFEAELSPDGREAVLRAPPERYPVESLARVLLAQRLLEQGGLLVHGVALAAGGKAALFTGPSGAGKSTLGQLCHGRGLVRLADELVAVCADGKGFRCEGTPWNVGEPGSGALHLLGVLAFAPQAALVEHSPGEVLRTLISNALIPDASASGRSRAFRAASSLVRASRAVQIQFAKDPSVSNVLRDALERE